MKKIIAAVVGAVFLAASGVSQAAIETNLVLEGGFEYLDFSSIGNEPNPTTTTNFWFTDEPSGSLGRIAKESTWTRTDFWSVGWQFYFSGGSENSLIQTLSNTVEVAKNYEVDFWHGIALENVNKSAPNQLQVSIWTSSTVDGAYSLAVNGPVITIANDVELGAPWENYVATFTAAELSGVVGQFMQLRVTKVTPQSTHKIYIDDVSFGPQAPTGDPELLTNPSDALALNFESSSVVSTGIVEVSYLEGIPPANVTITAVSVTGQSNPGSFSNGTTLPLTLTNPTPSFESLSILFDNSVANLSPNQSSSGLVEIVWNEVGSGSSSTATLPVSATFLAVEEANIIAVFDDGFNNADRALSGIQAQIYGGLGPNGSKGCNDTSYGTQLGLAPTEGGSFQVKDGNGGSNLVAYVSITNNTGFDAVLESLHFDVIKLFNLTPGAVDVTIYGGVSSNLVLSSTVATNFTVSSGNLTDYDDFDVTLTNLVDHTLTNGEGAVIEFAFIGLGGNSATHLDNIAVLGSGTAGATLQKVPGGWVSMGVTGSDTSVSQVVRLLYEEGPAAGDISINNITFSDETIPGAFGYLASLPVILSTPEVTNDVFALTFDNTISNLPPGEFAYALVTVEWNETGVGGGTRTLLFDAYATRPAIATNGVIAQFDLEFLTPDAAVDGVLGWMAGGSGGSPEGLRYDDVGCLDASYGTLGAPAAGTNGGQWQVRTYTNSNVATLTITNKTSGDVVLESIHFDVGRWYTDAMEAFTLSVSGDVSADPALLVETNLTILGFNNTDYDDFDVTLTNLVDHTLSAGQAVVFTFDFVAKPEVPFFNTWIDNIAVLGQADTGLPATLSIVDNGDGTVTVSWNTSGTLQSADTVEGVYSDVAGSPVSPAILPSIDAQKYYRVLE